MSVKLITYDLNKVGQKHSEVLAKIKSFNFKKLSESSYAISTPLSVDKIYQKFANLIDNNDTFLIIPLTGMHYGMALGDVHNWLNYNLD
ncbi:hypothetical protein A9308_00380 [Moraxella atlantae]|uniref:Uncharacterized protein n=1 Tax=Faucicola atlantae TaxID=34059 RepID=A0A1B8QD50_9GAMM|nr:hypothetical protein [Moraxella atlantae]OBX79521.1 hypothetical protein A9308_00380 [Moraxella atlantae]